MTIKKNIFNACVVECKRQQVGIDELVSLVNAIGYMNSLPFKTFFGLWDLDMILDIGKLVEPVKARKFRQTPVFFKNMEQGVYWGNIPVALDSWIKHQDSMNIHELIKEFLLIHPFEDGNGRVAFLLYNIKNGSFDNPYPLPDYFAVENRFH